MAETDHRVRPLARARPGVTLGKVVRERLREIERSSEQLAEAVALPHRYVTELISGDRPPPLPARTDLYERMTRFLRLTRNDLADCALAERAGLSLDRQPDPAVADEILALCNPETARQLRRRAKRDDDAEIIDLIERVLSVVCGTARRSLDSECGLRVAAARSGVAYAEIRFRVIEFLDKSPAMVTIADLDEFVRPQIALWDVDFPTGVLRVVLRGAASTETHRRRPIVRMRTFSR